MNGVTTFLNSAGESFVDFAVAMLVQSGTLIVILLGLDLLIRKRVRAVFRCWMWMLVLVKLMLPTSLSLPTGLGYWFADKLPAMVTEKPSALVEEPTLAPPVIVPAKTVTFEEPAATAPVGQTPPPAITEIAPTPVGKTPPAPAVTWQAFVFLAWLAAVAAMLLLLIQRMFFVRGLIAQSRDAPPTMTAVFHGCRAQMQVRRHIALRLSPVAAGPSVCGLFRAIILMPEALAAKLDSQDLKSILLHELAHIKRGDLWVSFIQTLLQIIYIYNPLLWLANAIIRKVREQAVDEMVLAAMGEDAEDYPETLLNVSRLTFSRPALSLRLVGVVESKKALTGRIKHILSRPFPKTAKLGIAGLIVIVITAAVLLPMAKAASKQPGFIIKGTVTDAETGRPIAGAKVGDVEKYAEGKQWTITDSNGNYEYKTWYEEHAVKCEIGGYEKQIKGFLPKLFGLGLEKERVVDFELTAEEAAEQSEFKTTLPNSVTVELLGVCEYPREGRQWWRPDGTPFSLPAGIEIEDRISRVRVGDNAYQFLFRYNSQEELVWNSLDAVCLHFAIEGHSDTDLINFKRLPEAGQDGLVAKVAIFKEPLDSTTIQANLATGNWQTKAIRDISKIDQRNEDLWWFTSKSAGWGLDILHRIEGQQIKTIAIDREGNEYRASYSLGSFGGWMPVSGIIKGTQKDERRYCTGLRKDDRLVKFKLQSRPFWSSVIGNVSLKPNFKTDVQTEVETAIARFQTAPSQTGADMLVSLIDRQAVTGAQGRRILELLFRPKVTKRKAYPLGEAPWISVERNFLIDFDNMQLLREEDLWVHGQHQRGSSSAGGNYLAPTPRLVNLHPVPKEPGTYEFEIRYKYGCTPDHKKVKPVYQCEFTVPVEVLVVEKEKAEKVTLVSNPKLDESMPRAFSIETPRLAGTYLTSSGKSGYTGGIEIHYEDIPHAAAFLRVFRFSDGREAEEVVNRLSTSTEQPIRLRANSSGTLWVGPQVFQLEQPGEYSGTLILRPSIEAAYKDPRIKSIWNGELTFPISFTVEAIKVETAVTEDDIGEAKQAGSLEHFTGRYSRVRDPELPVIEITKKADVFIFHGLGGPSFEMEAAEDGLKFADGGGERFLIRYDPAHDTYYMDNLGIPGETRQVVSVELIKLSAKKPQDVFATTLPNGVTVELLGVCEYPSEGKLWWRPDGAALKEAPIHEESDRPFRVAFENPFEFALRVTCPNEGSFSVAAEVEHLGKRATALIPIKQNEGMSLLLGPVKEGVETANLRIGIAAGDFDAGVVCDVNDTAAGKGRVGDIVFSAQQGRRGRLNVTVSGAPGNSDCILVLVDSSGDEHNSDRSTLGYEGSRIDRCTFGFSGIGIADIRQYRLKMRKHRWVTFKNVSLKPNFKTDAEVEEGAGSKSASKPEFPQERYEGRTIEQWMKRWDRQEYDDIKEATDTLVRIGRPAVPAMIRELKNRTNYGWHAVGVLAKMGPEAEDGLAALIEAALDKELRFGDRPQSPSACRGTVLYSLSNMTWARDRVVPLLQRIAEDDQEQDGVRASAISALRNVGKEAVSILEKLTEAQERSVRDSAHGVLAHILEKEEGLSRKDYYARLVEQNPFDASAPTYLVSAKGIFNSGRPHPLTQRVKQLYRDRLAKEPDPQLAWQLATIIHNGLRNTELQWAAPAGGGKVQSTREDPAENFTTLAEALEMVFAHAGEDTELWFKSGIALAKLRLLQGDWAAMNAMLEALGKEPIPEQSRSSLPAPPVDWEKDLAQWTIADDSMRSGNCNLEFRIEKDGTGLKGAHFLVKRAPLPTNVLRTGVSADTLFFAPHPLGDARYSFGYMGNDRAMTRYAVSDESGVVRFNKLPDFPVKIEVLVPTSNFEEVGSDWELWMEVVPGQFKIAKIYGGADAVGGGRPPPVERLREGRTVHYPRLVVRPVFAFNVADWDSVSKDFFMLTWQGLDAARLDKGIHYELEMFLSAPGTPPPFSSVVHAPVVDSAKLTLKQNQWLVGQEGVGGLRLGPGNIYMFEVRAVDESGIVVARWPRTRVWVPWGYRQCEPPFASLPYLSTPDQYPDQRQYNSPPVYQGLYQGSWWKVDFEYEDGRKETLREKVTRFLRGNPNIFEYEYLRLRKAWIDWRDGDMKAAREQLEKLATEVPKGSVVRGTARHLLKQMDAEEPHPQRLKFVPDYDADDVKASSAVDSRTPAL